METAHNSPSIDQSVELSIVIPLFNESENLPELITRLENVTLGIDLKTECILVDDGSSDRTWVDIQLIEPKHFDLHSIALSRNFGKEAALTSGLRAVTGQVVVILDADCQDPPELILQMLDAWRNGADVVNMQRLSRAGESWLKKLSANTYYRLLNILSETQIPPNVGDFRLLSRRVVDEINRLGECNRYMKGILSWPGFNQVTLGYHRQARNAGKSKWNYWSLLKLAFSGITAFSNKPLRLASFAGIAVATSSFLYGLSIVVQTLMFGEPVAGYPSMMTVILFIGGIQLITIGILGEYVGHIYTEVKNRPQYIVREETRKSRRPSRSRLKSIM